MIRVLLREDKETGEPLVVFAIPLYCSRYTYKPYPYVIFDILTADEGHCNASEDWIYSETIPAGKDNQDKLMMLLDKCGYSDVKVLTRLPNRRWRA